MREEKGVQYAQIVDDDGDPTGMLLKMWWVDYYIDIKVGCIHITDMGTEQVKGMIQCGK